MTLLSHSRLSRPELQDCGEPNASPELFRYEPLERPKSSYTFRLLNLLPGSAANPIRCEIQDHSVENAPPYEALSYCWGDIAEKSQIKCNDCTFGVTASVVKALTYLRHSEKPRLLWIDQICIDQQNLPERSYQVSIMRLIYTKAVRTIVWLGTGETGTNTAFESITRLAKVRGELESSGVNYSRLPDADHLLAQYGLPTWVGKDKGLCALMALLEQPWFERVWIIQEVAVSSSVAVVQGKFETTWEDFAAAVLLIWELRMNTFAAYDADKNIKNVHFIDGLRRLRKAGKVSQLRNLLGLFRDMKATDPRDKVYALAGLSAAFRVADPSMFSYNRSVSDAYRLWTIHILRNEQSLETLSAVNRYKVSNSTVSYSWVPDWNTTNDNIAHHATAWPSATFKASASSEMDLKFQNEETVLGLTGHLLDRVEAAGLVFSIPPKAKIFGFIFLATFYHIHQIWRSWEAIAQVRQHRTYTATRESIWDAYWQTILFGEHGHSPAEKERVRAEFDTFYAAHRRPLLVGDWLKLYWIKHLWAIYCVVAVTLKGLGVFGKYKRGSGLEFTNRASQTGWRRMIRTQAGYIGLAVHATEAGDYVALFKGSRLPLVVRPTPDGWRLIGDSYVHGVMHGEAWQENRCSIFWIH